MMRVKVCCITSSQIDSLELSTWALTIFCHQRFIYFDVTALRSVSHAVQLRFQLCLHHPSPLHTHTCTCMHTHTHSLKSGVDGFMTCWHDSHDALGYILECVYSNKVALNVRASCLMLETNEFRCYEAKM